MEDYKQMLREGAEIGLFVTTLNSGDEYIIGVKDLEKEIKEIVSVCKIDRETFVLGLVGNKLRTVSQI